MNKIEYILSFAKDTFSADDIIEMLNSDIGFDKGYIELGTHNPVQFSERYFKDIKNQKDKLYLKIREEKEKSSEFTIVTPSHFCPPQNILWKFDSFKNPPSDLFSRLIGNENFYFGYAADVEDQFRQNETHLNNYKVFGLRPKRIKHWINPDLGWKEIDTRNNPGRRKLVCNMWITSTWKMWFGKPFFDYVSKERILSFGNCDYVKELDNGVIEIQLYENPHKAHKRKNRRIQQEFRDWIEIDELIVKLDNERNRMIEDKLLVDMELNNVNEISFGYKTSWIAIKSNSCKKVVDYFKENKWSEIDFKKGVDLSYEGKKFISPPIKNWVLFTSIDLPCPETDDGINEVTELLNQLSTEFGEVNFFANHRVSDFYSWAKSKNGKLTRGFTLADGDEPFWNVGNKTGLEEKFVYPFEKSDEPEDLNQDIIDEDMVMRLADDWSVNPTELDKISGLKNKKGYISE